ncbi:hypothetical protein CEP52_000353 [Fusarium oligoseptatum]|uniref:Uncharacterized protein n=1 Tax=Fusarium oligoseptatum TaxID=2604345 RepID=A0A428UQR8_9HYPO|nr:hypothetical protein CEP52_000353 [Fusarium oligoseptatum]
MRRAALNKSKAKLKDRPRDDLSPATATATTVAVAASSVTAVEALPRDEGFQAHNHELLNPSVPVPNQAPAPPAPVSASVSVTAHDAVPDPDQLSQLDHDRQLLVQPIADSSHAAVSSSTLDAPMTDAFPAELDAVSATAAATAATNTTSFAIATSAPLTNFTLSTAVHLPHHHGDDDDDDDDDEAATIISNAYANTSPSVDSDHDDDIDLDLDVSHQPPILSDLYIPTNIPNLDPDYVHHHHAEDDDLDMSDSDGGASLDDDGNYVPQLQVDHDQGHSTQPQEDDDAQAPSSGPVNYLLQTYFHVPSLAGAGIAMDGAPPLGPWAPPPNIPFPPLQPPTLVEPLDPAPISNPNPTMLGSENYGLIDFLWYWARQARLTHSYSLRAYAPCPEDIRRQGNIHINEVRYDDLLGDECDFQGMNWESMRTTRERARRRRFETYKNYVNKEGSDQLNPHMPDVHIPATDSWFRFRKFLLRRDVYLAHFQLRSVLACPSRSQVYYPGTRGVHYMNPVSGKTELFLNNSDVTGLGAVISTLDAKHGVLLAGTFNGEYYLKNLYTENKKDYSDGQITPNLGGITNHIQIHKPRRSSSPIAAISNNDDGFRVMDLATEKFLLQTRYRFSLNCTSISPDGRLRAMVGDDFKVIISDADTGQIQQELAGHRDFGFSCDWSDDGWTVATGFQDKGVKIWDARRWCDSRGISTPVCTIRSEMAGVRNLRFSPVGSGPRVLVAAEEADFVNIINAETFKTKQTLDIFGEMGGIAFTNEGQDLNVLVSDRNRGGLLQLERCGVGPEPYFRNSWKRVTNPRTDEWEHKLDDDAHKHEPYRRRPISTDAVAIF